ncbi:MAG: 30S ribosomal protein S8 [Chloroflexi bacterium]|nr:30S ribosomal protein S8 [Chloroflexota bacterium]
MVMTDPIADMLTRIRNGIRVHRRFVLIPASKMKLALARILKDEGFIENYEVLSDKERPYELIRVWLKYTEDRKPVITGLQRVSRPGRRVYSGRRALPRVLSGMGVAVISTPKGLMTDRQARRMRLGGEVVCYIW